MVLFLCSCSTPSRHMDLSISVMNISRQHCSWMKSRQISGWISPSSGLQHEEEDRMTGGGKKKMSLRWTNSQTYGIFSTTGPNPPWTVTLAGFGFFFSIFRFHHIFTWGNAFMLLLNGSNFKNKFLSIFTIYFVNCLGENFKKSLYQLFNWFFFFFTNLKTMFILCYLSYIAAIVLFVIYNQKNDIWYTFYTNKLKMEWLLLQY